MPIIDIFIYYLFLPVSSFEKGSSCWRNLLPFIQLVQVHFW
ncbi:hypothetical protein HMPREF9412_4395 [Paenibacillus sp. HGF5]|nr:hypothetical protein HMPREF9412_4395 [Paenibacillus sp. HGF5]